MKKYFGSLCYIAACSCMYADPLVVGYATTHLNNIPEAVRGVLVTPNGDHLTTEPMGPFEHHNLVLDEPVTGTYQAYFEVLQLGSFRLCPIVGGIGIFLCNDPHKSIPVTPQQSRIQTFASGRPIEVGDTSQPVCSFEITSEDLD